MSSIDWRIWRPVVARMDTLQAVQTLWSIDDLADAHEVLDIKEEMEQHIRERQRRE